MPLYLQPVDVPERCYLREVLLWLAFQRLPVATFTVDGKEIRETEEAEVDASGVVDGSIVGDETARAGIPPDPNWTAVLENQDTVAVLLYDDLLE